MAQWHVNNQWNDLFIPTGDSVIYVDPLIVETGGPTDTADSLSAPAVETLLPAGLSLWPRGAAWGSPDGEAVKTDSLIAGLTRVFMAGFAALYTRAWQALRESRSRSLVDTLDVWEQDFGLPADCHAPVDDAARLQILRSRVAMNGVITPVDFINLAATLGYVIAIREPLVFRTGQSRLGSRRVVTDTGLERQWVIYVRDVPIEYFRAGEGRSGVTRLTQVGRAELECEIRRHAPAWTLPVFNYGPHLIAHYLTNEAGDLFTDDYGSFIVVPIPVSYN